MGKNTYNKSLTKKVLIIMISSISSHIPSGDLMAQAVSEHQNHDRPQDIKADSQGALGASNDVHALQIFSWLGCLILQTREEEEENKLLGRDDISKDISKESVRAAINMAIMSMIMAG
ncbi:MAG TPA: hypothetical protein VNX00_12020 [Herbaspirillum sp.]|nr:hypothetical protein [Herbaspirillum sp.]